MQVNNSPMFSGLFAKKDDKKHVKHAGHGHAAHHKHNAHAHHNKHHQPAFGAVTASGDSVSFSGRKPKQND